MTPPTQFDDRECVVVADRQRPHRHREGEARGDLLLLR